MHHRSRGPNVPSAVDVSVLLSERDLEYLDWIRRGGTQQEYAHRHGYGPDWAKWKSRQIRDRLGVSTIREAIQMTDTNGSPDGVSRQEYESLLEKFDSLQDALHELTQLGSRASNEERRGAAETVGERTLSLQDHAAALGLSMKEVKQLQEEREYGRFKQMQQRLRDEEAAAAADSDEDDDEEGDDERSVTERLVDGLGGVRNLRR